MLTLEHTRAALAESPSRSIRFELGGPGHTLKNSYYSVRDGDREVMQTTREATEALARAGVIKAGPYHQDAGFYEFRQV